MSDEHDDDGLSQLFGPPGETGGIPKQRPDAAAPPPETAPPAAFPAAPESAAEPAPHWDQPTT
ncbi:hypothetical protein ACOI9R_36670, partial [Mesorhizobium japonicum]